MKGIKEIKNRIRAIDNAAKITSAMQLVASSKMKKAQNCAINSRSYLTNLAKILKKISAKQFESVDHLFFRKAANNKKCVILIGTDKGLCGVLNHNLLKNLPAALLEDKSTQWIAVGKKSAQFLARKNCPLLANFTVSDRVDFHEIEGLCSLVAQKYLEGEIDSVDIVYSKYVNTLEYIPSLQSLLPMDDFQKCFLKILENEGIKEVDCLDQWISPEEEIIFEPSVKAIVDEIARVFLRYNLRQVLLESKASEHSARMVAMKNATDNAQTLSQELKLEYNKARQYSITSEIIELSAASGNN